MHSKLPGSRRASHHRKHGFTLVEISVSLLLIGIATAVVAPAVRQASSPSEAVVSEVRSVLERARGKAAVHGRAVEVRLDFPTGEYTMIMAGAGEASEYPLERGRLHGIRGFRRDGPSGQHLVLRFSPLGDASAEGMGFESIPGTVTITLDRWTGRVDVYGF